MTTLVQRVVSRYASTPGSQKTASGVSIFRDEMSAIMAIPKKLGGFVAGYDEVLKQLAPLQELLQSRILKKAMASDLGPYGKIKDGISESENLIRDLLAIEVHFRQQYKDGVKFLKEHPEEEYEIGLYPNPEALIARVVKYQETLSEAYQELGLHSALDDLREATESSTLQVLIKKLEKLTDLEEWLSFLGDVVTSIETASDYIEEMIESEV